MEGEQTINKSKLLMHNLVSVHEYAYSLVDANFKIVDNRARVDDGTRQ